MRTNCVVEHTNGEVQQGLSQNGLLSSPGDEACTRPAAPLQAVKGLLFKALEGGRWVPLAELQQLIPAGFAGKQVQDGSSPGGEPGEGQDVEREVQRLKKRLAVEAVVELDLEGTCETRTRDDRTEEVRLAPAQPAALITEKWPLAKLLPHPQQAALFSDLPGPQFQDLLADIKAHGLLHPIEVLPDGTIICGHQRVRAARELGWAEIDACVRHDLADGGEAFVAERLINDNLVRRQLGPLEVARCYEALRQVAAQLPRGEKSQRYQGMDFRDRLAGQFNMSGRNLDRLRRVLSTPRAVQDAVSANRLSLQAAGRVAALKKDLQEEIARKIEEGEDPERVVAGYSARGNGRHKSVFDARNAFVRSLRESLADLEGRVHEVTTLSPSSVAVLKAGQEFIGRLLRQAQVIDPKQAEGKAQEQLKEIGKLARRARRMRR